MKRKAFTLVELLVVIGIIAVLIGMLLPALNRAGESAKRVECLSNLRQLIIAANIYANHNSGYYPVAYWYDFQPGRTTAYAWDLTTITTTGQPTQIVPGILWNGSGTTKVQQCPSYEGPSNTTADPYTGYNYNTSFVGHGQYEAIPSPVKMTSIRHTADVAVFGDGQYSSGANKFMRAPFPNPGDATFGGRWAGTQGFRHRAMTNIAFADGHAESQRDRFTANSDGASHVAINTGFLSPDNSRYGG